MRRIHFNFFFHSIEAIPEIIKTTCATCTDKEKETVRKVMNFFYYNRRNDFDRLFDYYDPERKYRDSMMKFMQNQSPVVNAEDTVEQSSENVAFAA